MWLKVLSATVIKNSYGENTLRVNLGQFNGLVLKKQQIYNMVKRCRLYGMGMIRHDCPQSDVEWKSLALWMKDKTFDFPQFRGIQ